MHYILKCTSNKYKKNLKVLNNLKTSFNNMKKPLEEHFPETKSLEKIIEITKKV